MKRDMDLIRDILLTVEASQRGPSEVLKLEIPDRDPTLVFLHCQLLKSAGFLNADLLGTSEVWFIGLTWAGHDLLDDIRDAGVWASVKDRLAKVGGAASLDVLKALAAQVMKTRLGLTE